MDGAEFRERRTRAGVTVQLVAEAAGLPAGIVEAWEAGEELPARKWRKLDHGLWVLERDLALARPDAPVCAVVDPRKPPAFKDRAAVGAFSAHVETCESCAARTKFIEEHVRPEPMAAGFFGAAAWYLGRLAFPRAPGDGEVRWSAVRANVRWGVAIGVLGAIGLSMMAALPVAFILVLVLLTYASQWSGIATTFFVPETARIGWSVLLVFPLYLMAGVVGGTILGLLRPLGRWRLGATLIGMIVGTIAFWAMTPVVAAFTESPVLSLQHFLVGLLGGSAMGGWTAFAEWRPPVRIGSDDLTHT